MPQKSAFLLHVKLEIYDKKLLFSIDFNEALFFLQSPGFIV